VVTATASPKVEQDGITLIPQQADLLGDKHARTLAAIAGTGGGKTSMGYWWLAWRMEDQPGYGWGLAEPTYGMLDKIILNSPDPERPSLIDWLKSVGLYIDYKAIARIIITKLGKIYLGSADNPDSMQGPALKGYWTKRRYSVSVFMMAKS